MALALLALVLSYLLGAVPFGFVLVRVIKGVDLRSVGSGNIGATNAMRALGRPLGAVAFILDLGKGWVPVYLIAPVLTTADGFDGGWLRVLCGAAAVCGHVWPIYLRFRGGKAVATGCGAIIAIDPLIFVFAALTWLVTIAVSRYVGLASMAMGLAFPLVATLRREPGGYGIEVVIGSAALTALILLRHRSNLGRMLAGTEPRIGTKKTEDAASHGG